MGIRFTKMTGSGNDFVVIDNRDGVLPEAEVASFTRAVCRRGLGIGADGVILIDDAREGDVDFRWSYFNADGSRAEMCGNGAMCGARFAVEAGIAPVECRFETDSGPVEARVGHDRRAAIRLPDPDGFVATRDLGGAPVVRAASITVGVPHAVVHVDDADAMSDFEAWGEAVRHHPDLGPDGANANLVHVIDPHTIRMRTYERGVEGETLACGTGAAASALVGLREGWLEGLVRVVTSSGLLLEVESRADGVWLTGEARIVAVGEVGADALR